MGLSEIFREDAPDRKMDRAWLATSGMYAGKKRIEMPELSVRVAVVWSIYDIAEREIRAHPLWKSYTNYPLQVATEQHPPVRGGA